MGMGWWGDGWWGNLDVFLNWLIEIYWMVYIYIYYNKTDRLMLWYVVMLVILLFQYFTLYVIYVGKGFSIGEIISLVNGTGKDPICFTDYPRVCPTGPPYREPTNSTLEEVESTIKEQQCQKQGLWVHIVLGICLHQFRIEVANRVHTMWWTSFMFMLVYVHPSITMNPTVHLVINQFSWKLGGRHVINPSLI